MELDEILKIFQSLTEEQRKELIKRLRQRKTEIPEDVKELMEKYQEHLAELNEIKAKLKELGYTPKGRIRKGYGDYDYRGMPIYEKVKQIIREHGTISIEKFEEELKRAGYKGITGTVAVVLRNLKEDGLIRRVGGEYVWIGEGQSTSG